MSGVPPFGIEQDDYEPMTPYEAWVGKTLLMHGAQLTYILARLGAKDDPELWRQFQAAAQSVLDGWKCLIGQETEDTNETADAPSWVPPMKKKS